MRLLLNCNIEYGINIFVFYIKIYFFYWFDLKHFNFMIHNMMVWLSYDFFVSYFFLSFTSFPKSFCYFIFFNVLTFSVVWLWNQIDASLNIIITLVCFKLETYEWNDPMIQFVSLSFMNSKIFFSFSFSFKKQSLNNFFILLLIHHKPGGRNISF